MDRENAQILNIRLDSTSKAKVLRLVRGKLSRGEKFYIVTPNPEIVLQAEKDKVLAKIINSADFILPDGKGLVFAAEFLGQPKLNLIRGREMFLELCRLANKKGWRVFLLGGEGHEAQGAAKSLSLSLRRVKIEYVPGPILDRNANPVNQNEFKKEVESVQAINDFAPQLLFVAFGVPKQEKWIAKYLPKLKIGGAMAVGGTFRYIAGYAKLPPRWIEQVGLEWLWRLITEPSRAKRILKATILFPLKVLWTKFHA